MKAVVEINEEGFEVGSISKYALCALLLSTLMVGSALGIPAAQASCTPSLQADCPDSITLPKTLTTGTFDPAVPSVVLVDLHRYRTMLVQKQGSQLTLVLDIPNGIGRSRDGWPTPTGRFTIDHITWNPIFRSPFDSSEIAPYASDKNNPLGVVAIVLQGTRAALHGTSNDRSIGVQSSHGCLRHHNSDITELAEKINQGEPVYIFQEISAQSSIFARDLEN